MIPVFKMLEFNYVKKLTHINLIGHRIKLGKSTLILEKSTLKWNTGTSEQKLNTIWQHSEVKWSEFVFPICINLYT